MSGMVIIGAGEAGTRAAFALREHGWTGAIALVGDEAGMPYERPPLSKPADGGVVRRHICDAAQLASARIDYRPDVVATAIDRTARQVSLSDGRSLSYDKLLLATGAAPRPLDCPGADLVRHFRSHHDATGVFAAGGPGARVAIIGGGLIGMELAAVFSRHAASVDVIEVGPSIMARAVPPHLGDRLLARHRSAGVRVHLGAGVAAVTCGGVRLADGRVLHADIVISAIGVVPRTSLAAAAGLATGNGILTDACLRTSDPDILAAGDCAAVETAPGIHMRLESWRNARDQAEAAARTMIGPATPFAAIPWFWSDQFDLGLQVVGLPGPHATAITRPLADDAEVTFYLDDARLVAAAGLGPGSAVARDIKLAEMLIASAAPVDPAALADPAVSLKALLRSSRAA